MFLTSASPTTSCPNIWYLIGASCIEVTPTLCRSLHALVEAWSQTGVAAEPPPPSQLLEKKKLWSHMSLYYKTRSDTNRVQSSKYLRATMKTMVPVTLGAALLGIHLVGNHQADGFVVAPAGERVTIVLYPDSPAGLSAYDACAPCYRRCFPVLPVDRETSRRKLVDTCALRATRWRGRCVST